MGSLERKLARRHAKDANRIIKNAMKSRLGLFNHLPDHCFGCYKSFDRKSREQVFTWNVRVVEETKDVKLFCPDCMRAVDAKNEFKKT